MGIIYRSHAHRYTQVRVSRKSRHFGMDAEIQAMDGNQLAVQMLDSGNMPYRTSCSRLQGHLSWPRVCHPWTLDFGIPAEMTGFGLLVYNDEGRSLGTSQTSFGKLLLTKS